MSYPEMEAIVLYYEKNIFSLAFVLVGSIAFANGKAEESTIQVRPDGVVIEETETQLSGGRVLYCKVTFPDGNGL